jgi:mono/diheme cytochrome c family protein
LNKLPAFHFISESALFHSAAKALHNESVRRSGLVRILFIALSAQSFSRAGQAGAQLPDGPGKATMQKICSGCHAPEIVVGRHETHDGWEQIVSDMVNKGANGTDDEFDQIINYLAVNFPKKADSK